MRFLTAGIVLLGFPVFAFAQAAPCAPHWDEFDPYKPSDLALVRQFGGSVLAHAPFATLLQLDPYVPIQGELLRQHGGALPVWGFAWYPWYPRVADTTNCSVVHPRLTSTITPSVEPAPTTVADLLTALERARSASASLPAEARSGAATGPPGRNAGVWIHYAGRIWVSAGPAVTFAESEFVRVGGSDTAPIFQRRGTKEAIIYVPTTPGVVAPFRATSG